MSLVFLFAARFTFFWHKAAIETFCSTIVNVETRSEVRRMLSEFEPLDFYTMMFRSIDEYIRIVGFVYIGTLGNLIKLKGKDNFNYHAVNTEKLGDKIYGTSTIDLTFSYLTGINLLFLTRPFDNGIRRF